MNHTEPESVPFEVKGNHVVLKMNGAGYVAEALKDPKEKIHLPYISDGNPELDLAALVHALDALVEEAYKKGVMEIARLERDCGLLTLNRAKYYKEKYGVDIDPYDFLPAFNEKYYKVATKEK